MTIFLTVLHVMVCLVLIVVVLLQRGKGAEIGAVFGGGAGSTVFGSRGAGNFLTKLTTGAAVLFMVTSLTLAYFSQEGSESTLFQEEVEETAPVEDTSPFAEVPPPTEETPGEEVPGEENP
jgi:preprotein translocase subunit SecG